MDVQNPQEGLDFAEFYACDVSCEDSVRELAFKILDRHADVQILINSAGIHRPNFDVSAAKTVFDVNFWGTVHMSYAFMPALLKTDADTNLVNIGSLESVGYFGAPLAYTCSKHALRGFNESIRLLAWGANSRLCVTLALPGGISTPMVKNKTTYTAPSKVASDVLVGAAQKQSEVYTGHGNRLARLLLWLFPISYLYIWWWLSKSKGDSADKVSQFVQTFGSDVHTKNPGGHGKRS